MKIGELNKFLNRLSQAYSLYAPQKIGKNILVEKVNKVKAIDYSGKVPFNTWKKIFLPPRQDIIEFKNNSAKTIEPTTREKVLAWGMNVLDLKALTLYDRVFTQDAYYQTRRRQIVVVGFHPSHQIEGKKFKLFSLEFSESVLEHIRFDLFIIKKGGEYLLYTGSAQGKKLLGKYEITDYRHITFSGLVPPAGPDSKLKELHDLVASSYQHPIWKKLNEVCLACGKCSTVCPTCFCFDLEDSKNTRTRVWGNCFNSDFGLVAGNQNFQDTVKQRIFFWYTHKFVRVPKQYRFTVPGCVSCQRCHLVCPVGINIAKVLQSLKTKNNTRYE